MIFRNVQSHPIRDPIVWTSKRSITYFRLLHCTLWFIYSRNIFKCVNTGGDAGHKWVDKLASSLLLALLNVLPPRTRHLAGEITNHKFKLQIWALWLVDFSGALPEKILQVQEADRIGMEVITVRTEELWLLWTRVWLHVCGSNQHCRRDIWFWLMSYEV